MEIIISIMILVVTYFVCTRDERRSNNRTTPSGYKHDFSKATYDITTKGKDYYHKQHLAGKYDVPDKK